jgi:predicted nuclease of predicted toxin-antitoxin system
MRRVLLDQNIPAPLARLLAGHAVAHASAMARGRLTNGDLLAAAQRNGFDIMVTADRGIL